MANHDSFRRLAGSHSFDGRAALLTVALFGVVLALGASPGAIDTARPANGPGGQSVVRASVGAEIAELRGARSRTFASARGTRTVRLFAAPVNVREGPAWRVADETLVERNEGYESRSTPFEVELPKHLSAAVKVGEHGKDVAMTLEGARGAPRIADAVARYPEALPGVDVRYAVAGHQLKEELILNGPEAPTSFRFALDTSPGLEPRPTRSGGIDFRDPRGATHMSIAPPFMYSRAQPEDASDAVSLDLRRSGEDHVLTLRADPDWVASRLPRGPVVIDPTVTMSPNLDCSLKSTTTVDTSFCVTDHLDAGSTAEGPAIRKRRPILRFDPQGQIPQGSEILDASLRLHLTKSGGPLRIDLHELSRSFSSAATWNRHDGVNPWASPGGDFKSAVRASNPSVGPALGWYHWDLTGLVEDWLSGAAQNDGILLKQADEDTLVTDVEFASSEYWDTGKRPYLEVTYEPPPPPPGSTTVRLSPNLDCALKSTTTVDTNFCPTDHLDAGSTAEGAAIRKRRPILRFDPQDQIPPGSEILDASLRLHLTEDGGPLRIDLHELSRGFSSAATWNRYDGANPWTAPGGDFNPAVRASNASVGPAPGWYHWDLTGLVEDWLSGAAQNNGILLKQANEDALLTHSVEFASSEHIDTGKRPYLEITYRPPPPPPGSTRVRLSPSLDCSLKSTTTVDTNFCPIDHLDGGSTAEGAAIRKRRPILRFDPQGQIPQGSEILDASLGLHLTKSGGPLQIDLHELSRGFSSAATWNRHDGANPWTSPGGDFNPAVRASNASVGPTLGWYHWEVTGLVEDWLSGPAQNNGVLLKQANEDALVTDVEFASSEYWDTSKRPYLEVTYEPPPPPPGSARVRLSPSLDCSLKSTTTVDTNFCPTDHLDGGSTAEGAAIRKRRSILRFDPQGQIPQGSEILDASLRLHLTEDGGPLRIDLHELSRGFSSAATWNRYDGVNAWTSPGGDFTPAVRASIPSVGPALGWYHWEVTGLVEDWLSGAAQNHGILLKQANEDALLTHSVEFASSEHIDTGKRPYLEVTYKPPLMLYEPSVVNRTGATLHWSRASEPGFGGYEVHRGPAAGFTPSGETLLATLDNIDVTSYRDDSAAPGSTVFYKLVSGGEASNERRVVLPAADDPARANLSAHSDRGQATWIRANTPSGECPNKDYSSELRVDSSIDGRALLRWDLRDIPADARVRSARLMLKASERGSGTSTFDVRPLEREWRESSSSSCVGDGVSWQRAHSGVNWTTPGGDAGPVAATLDVAAGAPLAWDRWDVTALVQEWIAGRRANHGVVASALAGSARYRSDIGSTDRPTLEIVFDDPEPVHAPTVTLIAPRDGDRVEGTIAVEATAGDDREVERVEFLLDGNEFDDDSSAPYSVNWDSRAVGNGSHTLRARAVDDVGNVALSEPVVVEVANFDPPSVALTDPPTGYADTVKADGPAGYWRLGEASGTVAQDASGNGRNGSYSGSFTLNQTGLIANDSNRSVRLSSGSGRVTLQNLSGTLGSQFTAEAWVKHPGLTSNNTESRVVSRNAGATGGWKLGVRRTGTGAQEAFFNFGTVTAAAGITPTSTSVFHLAGVYDGTAIRLYVDGNQVAQATASGTPNTSAAPLIGGTTAAHLQVDEAALYPTALTAEKVKAHFEVGQGRAFWVQGANELRATASAAPGRTVREVLFLVDDRLVGRDDTAPFTVTWNTLAASAPVPDGPHAVTARVVDDHGRETASAPVTVNVANNTAPSQQAELTAESTLPETLVDEQGAPAVPVDIRIRNKGTVEIAGAAAVLRYRWVAPDGSFDDSLSGSYALGGSIAPGAHRVVRAMVLPPALPEGLARSRFTLRFDLRDTGGSQTWWAERGNPPLEHSVMVQRRPVIGLGLERYYQYDGEALGGGMSQLVNLASGNNIIRFSPFEAPGRGLSTVVDLTYNAQGGETKGSALGDGWLLSVSSLSPFGEPLRCGVGTDAELKPDKCEEYALKDQQDLPSLALELVDADGTVHRFTGRRTGGRTFWRAPQGVHLYVHQLEADEQPDCDIVEPGMAYQPDIQPQIQALWAFTRPDGTTFYYQRNGWPTGVEDRNGNCIDLELTAPPSKPDRVRVSAVVDAAGVADPALRPRRTFAIDYYDDEPHPLGGKTDFPKVKSIRDHNGSKLSFHYYKDDRPLRITQEGGTTPDGLAAPSRSWVFTYADWDIDEEETVANLPNPAARVNPDPTITDNSYLLYSVRDPRGHETRFTYHGEKPQEQKDNAGKLKHREDREGETTTYNYNLATDTTTVDLPAQRQSRYAFDAEGSVLSMIDKVSAAREEIVRVSWTADRHVFRVTEPTEVGVPAEHFTEFEYNQNGLLTSRKDQLGRVTELEYEHIPVDDDDQQSGWVDENRDIHHISQLTKRITPRGKEWEFDHDDETGNLLELEDPEGFASRYEYDEVTGNLLVSRDGLDSEGNLPAGEPDRTTRYADHDANGLPTRVTDALGNITRFCSDDDGLLRWVQDARHASSPLPTDSARCFEHEGRRFRSYFDHDPFHRLGRTSEPKLTGDPHAGVLWTHARYDANDSVVEDFGPHESATFQPGAGTRTALTYDAMDRPTRETLFDFDTLLPQQQGGPLEKVEREETTEVEYDAAGRVKRVTSARGVASGAADDFSTSYVYDLLDRPLVVTRHGLGGEERPSWFCYDAAGDLRSITRPREAPEPATCGSDGATGDPSFTWRYEYTPAHELRQVVSPAGNTTTHSYDPDGNLAETVNPEGEKLNRSYDGRDLPVETIEDFEPGRRVTTRFAYDAVGNLRHLYSPRAIEAADGSPTPASDFVHTTEYDALDRPVRELLPQQGDEQQRYVHRRFDAVGNLTHTTVPVLEDDLDTLLGPPEQARECSTEEARKWVTCYTHFDPGWIKTSDDINGKVLFDYDPEGRQTLRTATEIGETTSRTYYRDGLLETFRDEGGNLLLRGYDPNGNLSFASDDGVSSTRKPITLELDHNGFDQVASTTLREEGQPTKVTEYTYLLDGLVHARADDREHEGSTVVRQPRRHEFDYDPDGRIKTHLDFGREAGESDDRRITHDYSLAGRETERVVRRAGQADPWQTTEREYFDNGLIRELRTYGGAPSSSPLRESHTVRYRDADGVYVNGHATSDVFFRKSPNPLVPCQTAPPACTQRWVYDGADRLVEEDDGHGKRTRYELTPAGGIKKRFNAADEEDVFFTADFDGTRMAAYTTFPNLPNPEERRRVLHYEDGNLECITRSGGTLEDCERSDTEPSPLLVEDFTYDYRDRLEVWKRPDQNRETVYEHDALDRPIRETEKSVHGTTIHDLSYIGATRVLADERETGARQKTRSYTHDVNGRPVAMSYRSGGGQTHDLAYAFDPRDNVSMLLDEQGVPKAAYGYTAYGEPDDALTDEVLPDTGNNPADVEQINPFRYSSKRSDALSGKIDMGARQFGPDIGQFLQADQYDGALADLGLASDPLTGNRYALAAGNPISYIEVDGHMLCPRVGDCGDNATAVNRQAANAQRGSAGSGGGGGGGGAQSTGNVFEQSLTSSLPLLGESSGGAGADPADDSEQDGGGGGLPSPVDAITGAADLVEDIAVEHVMHQTTCAAESPKLYFWNTECFEESIPDPKATVEACTQGNPFEAAGRLTVCVGTVVGTRRGFGSRAPKGPEPVVTTGQRHHVISTRIGRAIERHPTLAGEYSRRDPRFITQGLDEAAHRGYQRWHRDLDEEVIRWLGQNRNVTPKQFESYLRSRYSQPDLRERFPNGF